MVSGMPAIVSIDKNNNCNFALGEPELTTPLAYGGVFIQGDSQVQVTNGETRIPKIPPMALYSPLPITVRENEEDLVYPPSINVTNLIVVETKLRPEQIEEVETQRPRVKAD